MFDVLSGLIEARHQVEHIAAWTGMSVTALVACGAAVYLDPGLRKIAVRGAIGVAVIYGAVMYGNHIGAKDVRAEWKEANELQEAANKKRDADTAKTLAAKYDPMIAERDKTIGDLNRQVADYEKVLVAKKGNAACTLGAAALRLRGKQRP